jgi:hypothetical protein
LENIIKNTMPNILKILLLDQTNSHPAKPKKITNIIWANDNYKEHGKAYAPTAQIQVSLITGDDEKGRLIMPRALKNKNLQRSRTKTKAEVFTPAWVVKIQYDAIAEHYKNDDLDT